MKKVLSVLLCMILIIHSVSMRSFAEPATGEFKKGTWNYTFQCIRFSIFDLKNAKTVSVIDMFSEANLNLLKSNLENDSYFKNSFIHSVGTKFDYLLQAQRLGGNDLDKLKAIKIRNAAEVDYNYREIKLIGENGLQMAKYVSPIQSLSADGNTWIAPQYIKELLKEEDTGLVDMNILHQLGFYAFNPPNDGTEAEYFTDDYILLAEPVYYFPLYRVSDHSQIVFYGTATEYAIFDTQLAAKGITVTTDYETGTTIHGTMGRLTRFAGPAGVMTPEDRTFETGTGEKITIKKSPIVQDFFVENHDPNARGSHDSTVNMRILNEFGVDTLRVSEIKPLTLNINRTNQNFHCDTDVYLSFMLSNGSSADMLRDIDESYEFKLVLETLSDSELKLGSVTLTTEGLPAASETDGPTSSFVFERFHCPQKAGTWRFKAKLYQSNDGTDQQVLYFSDNGIQLQNDNMAYAFEVTFNELSYSEPKNTSAYDVMPKGFTVPSTAEIEQTLEKVNYTEREWKYYTVSFKMSNGEVQRMADLIQERAEARIDPNAEVNFYPNIPDLGYTKQGIRRSRSGYGVGIYLDPSGKEEYYYQNGFAYFPESEYTENHIIEISNGKYQLEKNPFSIYCNDPLKSDYSRVHFTPVWYPDGEYKMVVRLFDSWTPAGELSDYKVFTMQIRGTVYDDWYIVRR